ncbi:MAG: YbaK/EbsC family protein [Actinomycetes bacterium]
MTSTLDFRPAADHPELMAPAVARALQALPAQLAATVRVAAIDPDLADTAAFCAAYGFAPQASANCVVVAGRRDGVERYAACVVLATTRADVNGLVRRHLDVRKLSFARLDDAVRLTGMEFGGITALGLPTGWPVLVDAAVTGVAEVLMGSGVRGSKLLLGSQVLASLPAAQVLADLGRPLG